MSERGDSTREQIVVAATRLFYGEGIRAVSMDAVAEKAGVTKKTLYYHFTSKDETRRGDHRRAGPADAGASICDGSPRPTAPWPRRSMVSSSSSDAPWRRRDGAAAASCAPSPSLANTPAHPAVKAGAAHKKRFEAWFEAELRSHGLAEAKTLARQLVVLLDGATTVMLIHRDLDYVDTAGQLARSLVEQASRRG